MSVTLIVLLFTTKMLTIQSQLLTELSAALTVLLSTTKMLTIQSHFTDRTVSYADGSFIYN
ncbi:hypothetical protein JCM5805K_1566 [Lactococcus lactis subsp. lactis]|uniref:Uncharacterized protein n=1 Tax=Lactococcus lactis subsp. lactis TaxID=1360 RepID=A0A0B8QKV9_LACLL|nr:hypothetical protein [Lactococcus lactis]MCT0060281.1 hypothetical protein [Lactococcus lactis subsp. lactis]MCT0077508.1 hypothetical protein [Lactococcus lactis subsp. lactis]MCT0136380.1 hypothetical protein [Lactococcus lactis subsp. lactis]GAM80455.1 hypothetical protein JCM5805K_1566 [Lactococcus lactis subsp. lactis]